MPKKIYQSLLAVAAVLATCIAFAKPSGGKKATARTPARTSVVKPVAVPATAASVSAGASAIKSGIKSGVKTGIKTGVVSGKVPVAGPAVTPGSPTTPATAAEPAPVGRSGIFGTSTTAAPDPFTGYDKSGNSLANLISAVTALQRGLQDCDRQAEKKKKEDAIRAAGRDIGTGSPGGGPGAHASNGGAPSGPGAGQDILNMADAICKPKASVAGGNSSLDGIKPMPDRQSGNPQEFIASIAPYATALQTLTGYPASVMIAQAAIETGWGKASGYYERKSLVGHSCFDGRPTKDFALNFGGKSLKVTGHCNSFRPANEGGKYLSFQSPEDSLVAYLVNVLQDPNTRHAYRGIRDVMENIRPPEVGNWQKIVANLGSYAAAGNYRTVITQTITQYGLDKFDKIQCENENVPVASLPRTTI